jgi:hypothetical protein
VARSGLGLMVVHLELRILDQNERTGEVILWMNGLGRRRGGAVVHRWIVWCCSSPISWLRGEGRRKGKWQPAHPFYKWHSEVVAWKQRRSSDRSPSATWCSGRWRARPGATAQSWCLTCGLSTGFIQWLPLACGPTHS